MRGIALPSHQNASKTNPEASKRRYALISSIKVARKMIKVVAKMIKVVAKMVFKATYLDFKARYLSYDPRD